MKLITFSGDVGEGCPERETIGPKGFAAVVLGVLGGSAVYGVVKGVRDGLREAKKSWPKELLRSEAEDMLEEDRRRKLEIDRASIRRRKP
jgi:hypothetical protein